MRRAILTIVIAVGFLMIPYLIRAEIYQWVDDKGTIHFTDDHSNIPAKYLPYAETRQFPKETPLSVEQKSTAALVQESSPPSEQETPRVFSGLITGLDRSGTSITVASDGEEMVFAVSEGTKITTDYGQNVPFRDLKNGKLATIEYIDKDGIHQAWSVKVDMLLAATPNAVETDKEGNPNSGPGQLQNPTETQQSVWQSQKAHKLPKLPKLPKSSK
jgi:hypothetical protein